MKIGFKKVHNDAKLPEYAHDGDAGMDVYAVEDCRLPQGIPTLVRTGIIAEIPDGYELQVRPRSGMAMKGVTVWNSPGTIDSKYRGEIGVILMFFNMQMGDIVMDPDAYSTRIAGHYSIKKGDRIAQLVVAPVTRCTPVEVKEVSDTDRGTGGFGSTGV